jgi:ribosomal protein L11 methyltransferase
VYWLEVSVTCDGEAAEAVAEYLRPYAYNDGVVLEQLGDDTRQELDALQSDVSVKIYLSAEQDTPALRRRIEEALYHLGRLYPIPPPRFRRLEDKDWANAWKEHYHPFRIGQHLLIQPTWSKPDVAGPDDLVIQLDPGMAFGTGLHPTTQMCLQALEDHVQADARVLDVGTGSGILAIAAARLGASRVLGVDVEPLAVVTASENIRQNGVSATVQARQGELSTVSERNWDIVVVNILAPVIINLLSGAELLDYVAEGGNLLLSGIIDEQADAVEKALIAAGGVVVTTLNVRDWVTIVARPR